MADTSESQAKMDDNTPKAAKDKECPYCQQAFTSSSLGRHLDLYIKPRNPKKPDGIHDVEEIRRTRGGVTRRQPKGSGARRQTSTPAATPAGPSSQQRIDNDDSEEDESMARSPSKEASTPAPATSAAGFPIGRGNSWEAVNTTEQRQQQQQQQRASGALSAAAAAAAGTPGDRSDRSRGVASARNLNRQGQKAQLDMKQSLQDDARAAEMVIREIIQAMRLAQQRVAVGNGPFAVDPVTMDFPALTLQCLPAMPTLFALTQLPTASSWSTLPPGDGQYTSLKAHFKTEYQKFKAKCVAQAEAQYPNPHARQADARQAAIELAETKADDLERNAMEHLDGAYASWNQLSPERKTELWVLNLARGLATQQNDSKQQSAEITRLAQENASLKNQVDWLASRVDPEDPHRTPGAPAAGVPIRSSLLQELRMQGAGDFVAGFDDSTFDLDAYFASAIKRCKSVVTANRLSATGMSAQRPLEISMTTGPATPSAAERGTPTSASRSARTRLGPVKFSNSTPESLAQTGGAQRQQRKGARTATGRQPVPSGSGRKAAPASASASASAPAAASASTAPAAPTTATNAPTAARAPAAPMAPMEAPTPQVQQPPSQAAVEAKTELADDEMDVEVDEAEAEAEAEAEEEEEDEAEEEEEEDDDDDEEAEAEDDDDDDDDEDDTTPPAQQPQQAPAGPGAAGGRAPGGGSNANADDNDEDDEMSDKDADAEMEDDGDEFAHMHTPLNMSMSSAGSEQPQQPRTQTQPEFAYSRSSAAHHIPRTAGNTSAALINSGRLMPNMGLAMSSISSESMYMD